MRHWPDKLFIYEVNTWVWLSALSKKYKKTITLHNVPDEALDALAQPGIDVIWFMGIWQRSEYGRRHALKWKHEYKPALPDMTDDDVVGSAYAIRAYEVDDRIGGREGLASLRLRLRERGLRIMLDYVPNHVGADHEWIFNPQYCIHGTPHDLQTRRNDFYMIKDSRGRETIVAHGRDPYFPGWADTAQLNAFSPALRKAVVDTLLDIASQCDGIRCDMAMLMMNDIFSNTWRDYVDKRPDKDYWVEIIPQIRAKHPDFLFVAEVYWNMEYALLQQGFDYAYDKVLYDRIMAGNIHQLRQHLVASIDYQKQMMRFIENHDEPRSYAVLGEKRSYAAATLICTLPGGTLLHDGQFVGRTVKLPVQIKRQPEEKLNHDLEQYYLRLLKETRSPVYQNGQFYLFDVHPVAPDNHSNQNLLAYGWHESGKDYRLIVVNMTGAPAAGRVRLTPWEYVEGKRWRLYDVTDGAEYHRHGSEMTNEGLFILLDAFESHVFRFELAETRIRTGMLT